MPDTTNLFEHQEEDYYKSVIFGVTILLNMTINFISSKNIDNAFKEW